MSRRCGMLRTAAAAVAVAGLVAATPAHGKPAAKSGTTQAAAAKARAAQTPSLSFQEARLIDLVSQYRRSLGLSGLTVYPKLLNEARWYADDMARNDGFSVTHIDSLGRTIDQRFWDFGYPFTMALGQATASGGLSPEETFEQLRTSRLHDEIMRDSRFRLVGAGYGYNPATDSRAFWVISFAKYRIPRAKTSKSSKAARTSKTSKAAASKKRRAKTARHRRA